jgi:hypothetical protein
MLQIKVSLRDGTVKSWAERSTSLQDILLNAEVGEKICQELLPSQTVITYDLTRRKMSPAALRVLNANKALRDRMLEHLSRSRTEARLTTTKRNATYYDELAILQDDECVQSDLP